MNSEQALVPMGPPIRHTDTYPLHSYHGHQFIFRLSPHVAGVEARFRKGKDAEELIITYDARRKILSAHPAKTITNIRNKIKLMQEKAANLPSTKAVTQQPRQINATSDVMQTVRDATAFCQNLRGKEFSLCMASNIIDDINKLTEAKTQLTQFRNNMSWRLRNYTCADDNMPSSDPIYSYTTSMADIKDLTVDVLLNKTHSKIWKVDNFVTDAECDILMKHGKPLLRRATVAGEDGSSVVSENRKANQAAYNMHKQNPHSDPLWGLFQRVLEMTNHHTGYDLKPPGQEDFTIIQYNPDDQYTPHCDGSCDNSQHISTGRVATAVLYCQAANRGGATSFTKSDIFVVPKRGSATFFSYKGADGRMDDGYTEHSGCPVLEGEKWITTVWMREGVSESQPWHLSDPTGIRIMDEYLNNSEEY
eukprot:CAMPEP_0170393890 /NCGR_PEP_ID=MMETSP0117_2-20130122/20965_1 /TAXON_ID=400756 /ORGANISM="Durinskia baltica, Strain CSIRO CS-38" /LENGTH=419 /DNA_ID=CAMNT_0010650121 /DNA_START=212 /DNA_END=1471 /DNA_ORIENTATION=+